MRDYLLVYVNGERHEVTGECAFMTLSDYLRNVHRLTGTKIVCSEGDCGACTVLVGRPRDDRDRLSYIGVDSCILFLHQLDGAHVFTVEGLQQNGRLHPIQQSLIDQFGSQCGFCTPGFVTSMVAAAETKCHPSNQPTEEDWRQALTGNLCRCTGYVQILESAQAVAGQVPSVSDRQLEDQLLSDLTAAGGAIQLEACVSGRRRQLFVPKTMAEAARVKSRFPAARVVNGATDVGVLTNKRRIDPDVVLSLANIEDSPILREESGVVTFGARTTWTEIEDWASSRFPEFHKIAIRFGAPQIRHVSTIVGNIANGSPIADSLPLLFVTEAELDLLSTNGKREVPINEFYLGYKQFDLKDDELIASVRMPMPGRDDLLKLYKVSKRNDLDISTFTAAIRLRAENGVIAAAWIAYGGVGPTVFRLRRTEDQLVGQPLNEQTFRAAGKLARTEISPISDVRGSAKYRLQLAENILMKFYFEAVSNDPS